MNCEGKTREGDVIYLLFDEFENIVHRIKDSGSIDVMKEYIRNNLSDEILNLKRLYPEFKNQMMNF